MNYNVYRIQPNQGQLLSLIIGCLFLLNSGVQGQSLEDLVLEYNLFTNEVKYIQNGKFMSSPYIKEGSNVYVVVKEYNPYIHKINVEVSTQGYMQSSASLVDGIGEFGAAPTANGVSSILGGLNLGSSLASMFANIPGSRGAADVQLIQTKRTFNSLCMELIAIEEEINIASLKINKIASLDRSRRVAFDDIEDLRNNEHIRPSRIKELMLEEISYAFAKQDGEEIVINDILDDSKIVQEYEEAITNFDQATKSYQSLASKWQSFSGTLHLYADIAEDDQMRFILNHSDSISLHMEQKIDKVLNKNVDRLQLSKMQDQSIQLAKLRHVYEELQEDIFTFRFPPIQAQDKDMSLVINVQKKDKEGHLGAYKSLSQDIRSGGGWKVTTGLGLAFGRLHASNSDYSVSNGQIVSESSDAFMPSIASFVHAYKKQSGHTNYGASFGVGFPITGGDGLQSLNFYLGPTVMVGQKQRFLVTTGVMGAKATVLTGGWKVGDKFESISNELPVKGVYQLGYFISLSFDIIKQ